MSAPAACAPILMDLTQGSPAWHQWRERGLGSSDAPAVMGVSPWLATYQLWELKTGRRAARAANAAMRRGTALEASARREFEFEQGGDFAPACLIHGEYPFLKASLDGWSRDRATVLEIKAPGEKAHAEALAGRVPDYYLPQVQHLLLVSGAARCHYWSYTPEGGGVLVTVERDEAAIAALLERELAFWRCVETDTPPDFGTGGEIARRVDEAWEEAAREYRRAYAELAGLEVEAKRWRERLLALADGQKCEGFGVKVTPYERQGAIDYKAAGRELADVLGEPFDFERFRKPASVEARLTVEREA